MTSLTTSCVHWAVKKKKQGIAVALLLLEHHQSNVRDKVFTKTTLKNIYWAIFVIKWAVTFLIFCYSNFKEKL